MSDELGAHDSQPADEAPVSLALAIRAPTALAPQRQPTEGTFDYDRVPEEHRHFVRTATSSSRARMRRMASDAYHFGAELCEVKSRLDHGLFLDWLGQALGMSARTAERLMQIRLKIGGKIDTLSNLPVTTLYRLTAPSFPGDVFDHCMALAEQGQLTAATVEHAVRAAKTRKKTPPETNDNDALGLLQHLLAGSEDIFAARLTAARIDGIARYLRALMTSRRGAAEAPPLH
mgnify:CR=1 FL=1